MVKRPLFDVIISVESDDGAGVYKVNVVDRYHQSNDIIGHKSEMGSLDEAITFAKGVVTTFLHSTQVQP